MKPAFGLDFTSLPSEMWRGLAQIVDPCLRSPPLPLLYHTATVSHGNAWEVRYVRLETEDEDEPTRH